LQGDVGGFTAGSQVAWLATGTLGVNFTPNIFAEAGYRYFYMDYTSGAFSYKAAEAGPFMASPTGPHVLPGICPPASSFRRGVRGRIAF
jgi:hypothetical protein